MYIWNGPCTTGLPLEDAATDKQTKVVLISDSDSGKHGMTESSAERSAELFSNTSEMVPNGLNIPMYES